MLAARPHLIDAPAKRLQSFLCMFKQQLPCFSQFNTTIDTIKQPHAQFLFQPFYLLADRGLRCPQLIGRRRKTELAGSRLKHSQQIKGTEAEVIWHKCGLS